MSDGLRTSGSESELGSPVLKENKREGVRVMCSKKCRSVALVPKCPWH